MIVSQLEIFGFKSFMERLSLPLEAGLTAVVGPNGCGKSNLVDAIRWVLGENRASQLRGDLLEDVIFNGTEKHRPLGLAEVILTIRTDKSDIFDDIAEPDLRIEEILIELEKATASLNLADQLSSEVTPSRKVDNENSQKNLQFLQSQPVGEGFLSQGFQDHANNSKNFNNSTGLASRFAWLKGVNEIQVTRRFYRDGESEFLINKVPCRLRDIKDLFRAIGIGSKSYAVIAQGEVSRIITSKPEEIRLILEEAAGVAGFRDKISAARRRLEETEQNLLRLTDIISELSRQVAVLRRQAMRAKDRDALKNRLFEVDTILTTADLHSLFAREAYRREKNIEVNQKLEQVRLELEKLSGFEKQLLKSFETIDQQIEQKRFEQDQLKEQHLKIERTLAENEFKLSQLRENISSLNESAKREQVRKLELEAKKYQLIQHNKDLKLALDNSRLLIEDLDRGETKKDSIVSLTNQLTEQKDLESELVVSVNLTEKEIARLDSDIQGLQEKLLTVRQNINSNDFYFSDLLKVSKNNARIVQVALRELLNAKLVEEFSPEDLRQKISLLKKTETTSTNFVELPIELERIVGSSRLIDLIEVDPKFLPTLDSLLANFYHCLTVEDAISFFEKLQNSGVARSDIEKICMVTTDGVVCRWNTVVYTRFNEEDRLTLISTRDSLLAEKAKLELHLDGEREKLAKIREQLKTTKERQDVALSESSVYQIELTAALKNHGEIESQIHSNNFNLHEIERLFVEIEGKLEDNRIKLETYTAKEQELLGVVNKRLQNQLAPIVNRQQLVTAEIDSLTHNRRTLHSEQHAQYERAIELRRELDLLSAEEREYQIEIEKNKLEIHNLRESYFARYGVEIKDKFDSTSNGNSFQSVERQELDLQNREILQDELLRLRARLAKEGEVDPESISLYEKENARLEELTSHSEDLKNALSHLKETIDALVALCRERFEKSFVAIRKNFSILAPKVFGGGSAELTITDPANPLESGIEVAVRPPGKKLRHLELLSGGEKALSAISLIFAMFLERPSPLCVLDEVDAPLDDANLGRFLELINGMKRTTQFLFITHNKLTMANAQKLIGVTMPEAGVSKTISVSLQEAYSKVA
ncbi:MAG TPA: AAA family ATPase [Oligoflexia bacterium]|nr:AAA family ATPase [Oligoflexia bacterium]HMP27478.1 AAA family ATPase [Oligoflexia bacterium]